MIEMGISWDLLVASRLYTILFLFIVPIIHVLIHIGYFQPLGVVILGFSILLILKFVLFEPRTASNWFLKGSLVFILPITCIIAINFMLGVILNIIHYNLAGLLLHLGISIGTLAYFGIAIRYKLFKAINSWLVSKKQGEGESTCHFFKRHALTVGLIGWLIISPILILVPYSVYHQDPPSTTGGRKIGVWISSFYFDVYNPDHLSDTTLELLANESIYVVISIKQKDIGSELVERLNRCSSFGIEVHLSISVMNISYKYVNIWNFEKLKTQIDTILAFLNNSNLLGDPVTTLVYDMECLPEALYIVYVNSTIRDKLDEYYAIQDQFLEFNRHVREDYNLSIRICTDYGQGFDRKDGDDDLIAMRGLMYDDAATMSYMVYRRNNLGQNHILDHCRFLEEGETIILNSWKFEGYLCWNDLDCAIEDARLVLGYPGKTLHLEIWTLYYFLESYGMDGFHDYINALSGDWSDWPVIEVENIIPYSTFWDVVLIGISLLDLFGPFFRLINNAF